MTTNYKRILIGAVLALGVGLSGCATNRPPAEPDNFAQGRSYWLAQDYEQALVHMRAAAEAGQPQAQYALGYMYYNGQGTPVDVEQAMQWIRRSAEQGHRPALEALAQLAALSVRQPQSDPRAAPPPEGFTAPAAPR